MIRSKDWKLVHYLGNDDGELYDLNNDPREHVNLWSDPAYTDRKAAMLEDLSDWLMRSDLKTAKRSASWR